MDRRRFISAASATAIGAALPTQVFAQTAEPPIQHRLPATDPDYKRSQSYIEEAPVHQYHWASDRAVEDFKDMKFGLRIHWGIYSIFGRAHESWPFLTMSFPERQAYNQTYTSWNPSEFDADAWMNLCQESGLKMFA
ncbi:MAG TPA: alpha-L-fucosidase, partial [Acidobacteriaceae bacterium]|nr:alpha-L-fucosidase [Acidobacteriaceae bacterium]